MSNEHTWRPTSSLAHTYISLRDFLYINKQDTVYAFIHDSEERK